MASSNIVYEPLRQKEGPQSSSDCEDQVASTRRSVQQRIAHLAKSTPFPWILHLLIFLVYSGIGLYFLKNTEKCSPCFSEKMLGPPIIWEDKKFASNIHSNVMDPYSRDNPDVDKAWKDMIDMHLTTITPEEMANLPGGRETAHAYKDEGNYAVILEVFHQLHCLDSIRKGFFAGVANDTKTGFESAGGHADHCFSYLAQTLICHADVGVMTLTWRDKPQAFTADFNVTKQCRNYDAILDWAKTRHAKFHVPDQLE